MVSDSRYKALVVEDEFIARKELIEALKEDGNFEVVGEAANVSEAYQLINSNLADVLFLDIGLPGGNAFYLLSSLKKASIPVPPVIIVTANTEYEYAKKLLNDHKEEVMYILNKPFWSSWIQHCNEIVESLLAKSQEGKVYDKPGKDYYVNIEFGRKGYMVNPAEIVCIETGKKGKGNSKVTLKSNVSKECNLSLSQLLNSLPSYFFQINRFQAINLYNISLIDHSTREIVLENGQTCSIGSAFYDQFVKLTKG